MDTLTHGLLGAAAGALPLPRWLRAEDGAPPAPRAALLAGVIGAELPDLDYLLPAQDAVLHTLRAHRGLSHSLVLAPALALAASLAVKLVHRKARLRLAPLYWRALLAVLLAHLLPDLWTGWGTRLWLPFSEQRVALDWTMVVDPLLTAPLVLGAGFALRARRGRWRAALGLGVLVAAGYLGVRIALSQHLEAKVRAAYPDVAAVNVFPAPLAVSRWRYVVVQPGGDYAVGAVGLGATPEEQARLAPRPTGPVPPELAGVATVREALAWARFPVVRVAPAGQTARRVEVADLRYHLRGEPTLTFKVTVEQDGTVREALLDRGGSAGELWRRMRGR